MTEGEWLACENPITTMRSMATRPGVRKWRLLSCAICRLLWEQLDSNGSRDDVILAERFSDALVTRKDFAAARTSARRRFRDLPSQSEEYPAHAVLHALLDEKSVDEIGAIAWGAASCVLSAVSTLPNSKARYVATLAAVRLLIDEVMGNPFRPARSSGRLDRETLAIAEGAYGSPEPTSGHLDNARLAVLSDSLEDAGCSDDAILTHLRSPGPHVRGCWALDWLLGKS